MTRTPLLLRASAGTGKTYRVVELYAQEVLDAKRRPGEVVAITFTRKAAAELRARIRAWVKARGASGAILEELGTAPIANFHGLGLQLLRTSGFVASSEEPRGIVGAQGEDRALFAEACDEAWFGTNSTVLDAVERLAPHLDVAGRFAPALFDAVALAREDDAGADPAELLGSYDAEAARRTTHEQLVRLRARLIAARGEVTGKSLEKIDALLERAVPSPDAPIEEWEHAWQALFGGWAWRGGLAKLRTDEDVALIAEGIGQWRVEALCGRLVQDVRTLLHAAWARYEQRKREDHLMDFTDVVERAVAMLESSPALHAEVCARVRTVLVDEAQDTNRLQRRFVELLAGLRGPAAGQVEPARLVVVGDAKQSIYTFRGADSESFRRFGDDVAKLGGAEERLVVSYRSRARLVRALNHLGRHAFAGFYEAIEPFDEQDPGPPGAMRWVVPLPAATTSYAKTRAEARAVARFIRGAVDAGGAPGDFAVLLAAMTRAPLFAAALAEEGLASVLGGGGGLYRQPEVVDVVSLLAWLCDPDARLQGAVALRSPLIGLSDSALLHLFGPGSGETRLDELRGGRLATPPGASPEDAFVFGRLVVALPRLVEATHLLGAGELLDFLDEQLLLRATLLALTRGEQRLANFEKLCELAFAHDAAHAGGVARFAQDQLANIDADVAEPVSAVAAGGARSVTIGTIHQAKGLEYEHVVLADLKNTGARDSRPVRYARASGLVFQPKQDGERCSSVRWRLCDRQQTAEREAERARLLYVAVTRAKKNLTFVGDPNEQAAHSFAGLLAPWRDVAVREGVLGVETMDVEAPTIRAAAQPSQLASPKDAPAPSLPKAEPRRGESLVLPVTQLAAELGAADAGEVAPRPRKLSAGSLPSSATTRVSPLSEADARRLGVAAHRVLASLHSRTDYGGDAAYIDAILRAAGVGSEGARNRALREDLLAFLGSELGRSISALAASERRHELAFHLAIAAQPHELVLHGQIDLLYWDGRGPVVVDFKYAHRSEGAASAYVAQLQLYALAAEKLCNWSSDIRTHLVYLRDRDAVVSATVTRDEREKLLERIGAWAGRMGAPARGAQSPTVSTP